MLQSVEGLHRKVPPLRSTVLSIQSSIHKRLITTLTADRALPAALPGIVHKVVYYYCIVVV